MVNNLIMDKKGFWNILEEEILNVILVIRDNKFCHEEIKITGKDLERVVGDCIVIRESNSEYVVHKGFKNVNEWRILF